MKALEVEHLIKVYHGNVTAVDDISFSVDTGDFFALLGPNGAGKSTTIGIATHLIVKTTGNVRVFDNDIDGDPGAAKECIGVAPQEFNFNIFEKVENVLIYQAGYYGIPRGIAKARAKKLLAQLDLWDKRTVTVRELSGGMKRKLMLARALIHEPKLLILDEPTSGVDVETRREMWAFLTELNKSGVTIILTTHYLEEAETLCKKIAIIHKGKIVENTTLKNLLSKLEKEIFIIDLREPLDATLLTNQFKFTKLDDRTMSFEVTKHQNLATVFEYLNKHSIHILSLRNKSNRLEEFFIELTSK
jgi:ABC-2 type transport system ATP-binding protein